MNAEERRLAVKELLAMRVQATECLARADEIAAELLEDMQPGDSVEIEPGIGVRVQAPSHRFDPDIARELLSDEDFEAICVPVPNVAMAKKVLTGDTLAMCSPARGKPTIRLL
jgi:hypothetical protein